MIRFDGRAVLVTGAGRDPVEPERIAESWAEIAS